MSFIFSEPVEIDFLQPDDVGFRLPNDRRNTLWITPAVRADTLVNIIGNCREQNGLPIPSVLKLNFDKFDNVHACRLFKSPLIPLFQRGILFLRTFDPPLWKRGRGDFWRKGLNF